MPIRKLTESIDSVIKMTNGFAGLIAVCRCTWIYASRRMRARSRGNIWPVVS